MHVRKEAVATEIVCVLRYKRHHYIWQKASTHGRWRKKFFEHAAEEQGHADQIAERIRVGKEEVEVTAKVKPKSSWGGHRHVFLGFDLDSRRD